MHRHLVPYSPDAVDSSDSDRPTRILCRPAGKCRYSAWADNQFLGQVIARADGTWAVEAADTQVQGGLRDQAAALRALLGLCTPG
jgi:hypothetical protein